MKILIYAAAILTIAGCKGKNSMYTIDFDGLNGDTLNVSQIADDEYLIYYFLSPECPLSENYTKTISDITLEIDSTSNNFDTYVVFSGDKFSNEEILKFTDEYHIYSPVLLDRKKELTKLFRATVTPEVFIVGANGEIFYHGAIDNWAVDLGQKRQVITEHYLLDAIEVLTNKGKVKKKHVKAVGCFIE